MPIIKSSTPVLDAEGNPAAGRIVRAYSASSGLFVGASMTSDGEANTDATFANTGLLLQLDEDITDYSSAPLTGTQQRITWSGAGAQFSGASVISFPPAAKTNILSGGDFFVEFSFTPIVQPTTIFGYVLIGDDSASGGWLVRYKNGGGALEMVLPGLAGAQFTGASGMSLGRKYKCAVGRSGSNYYGFVDGKCTPITLGDRTFDAGAGVKLGQSSFNGENNSPAMAILKEVRIKKGVCLHTSDYTPSAKPFPNSASDAALGVGHYEIQTSYTGEVYVLCLDDNAGTVYNHQILRTTPV